MKRPAAEPAPSDGAAKDAAEPDGERAVRQIMRRLLSKPPEPRGSPATAKRGKPVSPPTGNRG